MPKSSLIFRPIPEGSRNTDNTIYVGNLDDRIDEELLYELMIQAGPVINIYLPKDRINGEHQGFAFIEFKSEKDADYAVLIMNQIRLMSKQIRVNKAASEKTKDLDVGANLFIGNLDEMVDSNILEETFSRFGKLAKPAKVARDDDGVSKGYGFVSYEDFESSDRAIESMNNQFLMNRPCRVNYAFKQSGKGERHGDEAERLLAAEAKRNRMAIQKGGS